VNPFAASLAAAILVLAGCSTRPVDPKADSLRRSGLTNIEALRSTLLRASAAIVAGQQVIGFTVDHGADQTMAGHVAVANPGSPYATGCASAIGAGRYLTAAHVVDTPPITVLRLDGRGQPHAMPATVIWSDPARDLAIVTAPGCPDEPSLIVAGGPPRVGDLVVVYGCWGSLSAGMVVDVEVERGRFLCAAPTDEGDSGGAIVNRQGLLVGVISGGARRNGVDYTKGALVGIDDTGRTTASSP